MDIEQIEKWYYTYHRNMFKLEEPIYDAYGGWHFNIIIPENKISIPYRTYVI